MSYWLERLKYPQRIGRAKGPQNGSPQLQLYHFRTQQNGSLRLVQSYHIETQMRLLRLLSTWQLRPRLSTPPRCLFSMAMLSLLKSRILQRHFIKRRGMDITISYGSYWSAGRILKHRIATTTLRCTLQRGEGTLPRRRSCSSTTRGLMRGICIFERHSIMRPGMDIQTSYNSYWSTRRTSRLSIVTNTLRCISHLGKGRLPPRGYC